MVEAANLVVNGSFERGPDVAKDYLTLGDGSDQLDGWVVRGVGIDIIVGPAYTPSSGKRAVDLDGTPGPGRLEQELETEAGVTHRLTFDLAGNELTGEVIKHARVMVGDRSKDLEFDTSMRSGWIKRTIEFVAAADRTLLSFESLSPEEAESRGGALIDNVVVVALPD